MNAQPGSRSDCITRFLIQDQFICLQWLSPHYEAGDFKARRNWENFPNQYICSLMTKFLKGEDSWLLRLVSWLNLECKPGNLPFLIRNKKNTSFRAPELVLTDDTQLQASLGFFRVLLLPELMTLALEVMDHTASSLKSSLEAGLRLGEDWGSSWDGPLAHINRWEGLSWWLQVCMPTKLCCFQNTEERFIHKLYVISVQAFLWPPDSCNFQIYSIII